MKGKIAEIVQAHVDGIIRTVRAEHSLTEGEFRKSKCPMAVRARTIVVKRMLADGFCRMEIAKFSRMGKGLIDRRLYPEQRARGNELRKKLYRTRKAEIEARA